MAKLPAVPVAKTASAGLVNFGATIVGRRMVGFVFEIGLVTTGRVVGDATGAEVGAVEVWRTVVTT